MQRRAGFTLIELMITMAILAILAAVAIPSYTQYIRRGKIAEAVANLQGMKTKMEQWFQDNRSYPAGCSTTNPPPAGQILIPVLEHFTLSCGNLGATTYTITATGGVAGGDQSMVGIAYTIDQGNARSTTITSGSPTALSGFTPGTVPCWVAKKPAQC
jgi:type IV pilus assembly protein PilE